MLGAQRAAPRPRSRCTLTAIQCLMCKSSAALPSAELCAPCQREFEGLSEKPCLAVLRFDMAQRDALQVKQRTEEKRLSELKALFSSRSRFVVGNSEEDEILPISSSAVRATARREVAEPANVAAKIKVHRSPRGTTGHRLEGLASSEAKHEAARQAMERRRRIRRGEVVTSEEEEEDEDNEEEDNKHGQKKNRSRRANDRSRNGRIDNPKTSSKQKHVVAIQTQRTRRNMAFCRGMHPRIGRTSPVLGLSAFLVKSILSMVDDALLDLGLLTEHSLLSPMGPSKATRGAVTAMVAEVSTRRVFTGSEDGSIVVWNFETGNQRQVLRGHSSAIQTLYVMTNQQRDGSVCRTSERKDDSGAHDFSSWGKGKSTEDLVHRVRLLQLRFKEQSPDSLRRLLRYHRGDVDAATTYVEAHFGGSGVLETPCVPAASATPAGASSNRLQPFTPRGTRKSNPRKLHGAVLEPSRECSFLLVSGCAQGAVVWSGKHSGCLSIRQRLHHISGDVGPVDSIAALAGGGGSLPLLVCGGKRSEVHLWDLQAEPTGSVGLRHSMVGHSAPITALAMPHCDQAAGATQLISCSNTSSGLKGPSSDYDDDDDEVERLWCVSGCEDGTIRRWDLVHGVSTHILEGHDSPVTCLALASVWRSPSKSHLHGEVATDVGVGFWRLFSGGDTNDKCIRCWNTFECFSSATEARNTPYRYDQGGGHTLSTTQATAAGSSRLLGHKLEVCAGVKSMCWVAPNLVGETSGCAAEADGGGFETACTDYAGWLCCTLTDQTVLALRAADCAGRGKINLGVSSSKGRNLEPPVSSLVGIIRSTVAKSRSRERGKLANAVNAVVVRVPLRSGDTQATATSAKQAVMVACAVGDKVRIFTTTE